MMYQRMGSRNASIVVRRLDPPRVARVFHTPQKRPMIDSPAVMYGQDTLGFSLNPFSLIKSAASAAVGAVKGVFKSSTVSLPGVPGSVPIKDIPRVAKGVQVTFGQQPTAMDRVGQAVEQIPGGLGTVALVALVGMGLLMFSRRR